MGEDDKNIMEGFDKETFHEESVDSGSGDSQDRTVYTSVWNPEGYESGPQGSSYTGMESAISLQPEKESKALDICALVFGILSVVCCCCGGIFAIVGLVLSIIAMTKGKKSGMVTAGLICSIVGILINLLMLVYLLTPAGEETRGAFMDGFRQGYEQGYNGTYDFSD